MASIGSNLFDPVFFLCSIHGDTSYKDIVLGRERLARNSLERDDSRKDLVRQNFNRFVNAKNATESVFKDMKDRKLAGYKDTDRGMRKSIETIAVAFGKANEVFGSLIARRDREAHINMKLLLFENYNAVFKLPNLLKSNIKTGNYLTALSAFKKAKEVVDEPSAARNLLKTIWNGPISLTLKELKTEISEKLKNPIFGNEVHIQMLQILSEIENDFSPFVSHFHFRCTQILEHITSICTMTNRDMTLLEYNLSSSTSQSQSQSPSHLDEQFHLEKIQSIEMALFQSDNIFNLENVAIKSWQCRLKMTGSVFSFLFKECADLIQFIRLVRSSSVIPKKTLEDDPACKDLLNFGAFGLFAQNLKALLENHFNPVLTATAKDIDHALISIIFLQYLLPSIYSSQYNQSPERFPGLLDNLSHCSAPNVFASPICNYLALTSVSCLQFATFAFLADISSYPKHLSSHTKNAKTSFDLVKMHFFQGYSKLQTIYGSVTKLIWELDFFSKEWLPQTSFDLLSVQLIRTFCKSLHDFVTLYENDFTLEMDSKSISKSGNAKNHLRLKNNAEIKIDAVNSDISSLLHPLLQSFSNSPQSDLISHRKAIELNLIIVQTLDEWIHTILPNIISRYYEIFDEPFDGDNVQKIRKDLLSSRNSALDRFCSTRQSLFTEMIRLGTIDGGFDWNCSAQPRAVRPYIHSILLELVNIKAQVMDIISTNLPEVFNRLVEHIWQEEFRSLALVKSFSPEGGALQAFLDISFMQFFLKKSMSQEAVDLYEAILQLLDPSQFLKDRSIPLLNKDIAVSSLTYSSL